MWTLLACAAGYVWLAYSIARQTALFDLGYGGCLFKHVTNIPCPSCGSTRSVLGFFEGNLYDAVYYNPFGLIIVAILTVVPLWIAIDFFRKEYSFHRYYVKAEDLMKKRWVAIPLIALVVANWIWNIYKDV